MLDLADSESAAWELGWPSYRQSPVERWQDGQRTLVQDYIAEEVPVSLVYNGVPHVVMLATPTDLEDFAAGFSITEGIVNHPAEILSTRVYNRKDGIEVRIKIPEERFVCMADKGRNLTGRTGCGLCGSSTLQQAIRHPEPVSTKLKVQASDVLSALSDIKRHQKLNRLTGAVHAAGWALSGKGLQLVREDVGRHNALDKLIGALYKLGRNTADGFIIVTSRASFEMVQKTAVAGIGLLAAISAPTGLAIRLAEETGLTLVGFARDDRHVVYSHSYRLIHHEADLV